MIKIDISDWKEEETTQVNLAKECDKIFPVMPQVIVISHRQLGLVPPDSFRGIPYEFKND